MGIAEFPFLVTRNVTVTSAAAFGSMWPELDLMYTQHKLRLESGVQLLVSRLVISRFRSDNPTRIPGLDLIAPTQSGLAFLVISQAAVVHPACYPTSVGMQNVGAMIRPTSMPGEQRRVWDTPQTGCIPSGSGSGSGTRISRMALCYGIVNFDVDVATYGADMDPATSKPVFNGQILAGRNQSNLCEVLLTLACVQQLGPLACYYATVGPRSNGSSVASTATSSSGAGVKQLTASPSPLENGASGDGGGGDSNATLIAALCGSLIGAAVLAAVVAAALLVRRRRLRSQQHKSGSGMGGGEQALGGAGSKSSSQHGGAEAAGLRASAESCRGGGSEDTSHVGSGSAEEFARPLDVEAACGAVGPVQDGAVLPPVATSVPLGPGVSGAVGARAVGVAAMLEAPVSGASDATSSSMVFAGASTTEQQAPVTTFTPRRADLHMNVRLVANGHHSGSRFSRGQQPSAPASGGPRDSGPAPGSSAGGTPIGSIESAALAAHEPGGALPDGVAAATDEVELLPVLLGKGAFGQVVEGMFRGQRVAVKLLPDYDSLLHDAPNEPAAGGVAGEAGGKAAAAAGARDKAGRPAPPEPYNLRSFADEVEVLSRVDHPNVVRLLGACLDPPRICLVMERMQTSLYQLLHHSHTFAGSDEAQTAAAGGGTCSSGGTAAASLRNAQGAQPMPVCKALHIALGVARGLEYLHPTVLHRDLKPANVLLNNPDSDTPEVKITDFGISRLNHATLVTQRPGAGTPAYLAPECYEAAARKRGAITHRADMYSFGVMLWELLTGFKPWDGYGLVDLAAAVVVHRQRPPLEAIDRAGGGGSRCPASVRALVAQCWEHDPLRRPAAAEAAKCLEMALQELAAGGPQSAGTGASSWQPALASSAAGAPRAGASDPAAQATMLSVEQMQGPPQGQLQRPLGTAPAGEEWYAGGLTDFSTRTGVPGLESVLNTTAGDQTGTHWIMSDSVDAPGTTPGASTRVPSAAQGQTSAAGGAHVPIRFAVRVWSPAV
ncbi:hypothetical protein HXX76_012676 [Chlamydomonas incerta]|uniref:Protein kinase domain-containing protein n=1 Tax=Chlamydomonas incerta TaxID=51695 RepID=A0A835SRE2_CHLIN|nr:hypothetical protein HXX76_012676 [Chlamydomonas incerta]|eukprot:KAG2426889.1 hypothetical protein HXX76_012676 [Chlamydomonas incerta]